MKLSAKLIEAKAVTSCTTVKDLKFLDLTKHGIAIIEYLQKCGSLQTLLLPNNNISIVENLALCHQLWHLDLSCNDITNLYALSRFIALGTLNLAFNDLSWSELMKIRHMHILELYLHGNKKLEKDPNYRAHVIDCLPATWVLDGSLVTAGERIQVERFFQDSALSNHPVRHKLTNEQFIPSPLKKIQVEGTYGERAVHLMMRFPTKGPRNVETDKKRLLYLAYNLQQDMFLEYKFKYTDNNPFPLPDFGLLLESRADFSDQCNVLLLLLVTFLDFSLPFDLLQDTIALAKLENLCEMDVRLLFAIPKEYICRLAVLLLSAIKIDRHDNKNTGLYEKLYLALHYSVEELTNRMNKKKHSVANKVNHGYRDLRALLACEIIQLFCIVPKFFQYITTNEAVMHLVTDATNDGAMVDKIVDLMNRIDFQGGDDHRIVEEVADFLVNAVQRSTKRLLGRKSHPATTSHCSLLTKKTLPKRPQSTPIHSSTFLATGRPSPEQCITITRPGTATPQVNPIKPPWKPERPPKLGDKVLLGPQNLSFIIALPEFDVALIQMHSIPVQNGSVVSFSKNTEEHYAYLDMVQFEWAWKYSYWKPCGTEGDRITLHDGDLQNPPTSPSADDQSPRVDESLDENETATTIHPSPRDSIEEFPLPISSLIKEKLKLGPEPIFTRTEKFNQHKTPNTPVEPETDDLPPPVSPLDLLDMSHSCHVTTAGACNHSETSHSEMGVDEAAFSAGLLYDYVKCAMDTVRSNNEALVSARGSEKVDRLQETSPEPKATISTKQKPSSAKKPLTKKTKPRKAIIVDPTKKDKKEEEAKNELEESPKPTTPHRLDLDLRLDGTHQRNFEKERKEQFEKMAQRPHSSSSYRPRLALSSSASRPSTASSFRGLREQQGSPLLIQMGNYWLAGGRDLNSQERIQNFKKTQHTPGWMDGLPQRPKSVGPHQQRTRILDRRSVRSATIRRDQVWMGISFASTKPHPSPATSELNLRFSPRSSTSPPPEPSYLDQARQQNFGVSKPATPPYGGPKKPSSPLRMVVK